MGNGVLMIQKKVKIISWK